MGALLVPVSGFGLGGGGGENGGGLCTPVGYP